MSIHITEIIYKGFWTALDWIFPPVCAGCGEPGYRLCPECHSKISYITGNICKVCGLPVSGGRSLCIRCEDSPPPYDALRSLANYEGIIRDCIHALKYENDQSLGDFFSKELIELVQTENWIVDMVIPVPLSPFRVKSRGYNQSALLAYPLAMRLSFKYRPFGMRRTRNTRSQVELSAEERRMNVRGAFQAVPEIVGGKRILLVDDVTTTGSTIEECARALKAAGASSVYCLTLARPVKPVYPS